MPKKPPRRPLKSSAKLAGRGQMRVNGSNKNNISFFVKNMVIGFRAPGSPSLSVNHA